MGRVIFILLCWLLAGSAVGDEIRPGYLELQQENEDTYSLLWKVPGKAGQPPALQPQLPQGCTRRTEVHSQHVNGAWLQRWYVRCARGLPGGRISIRNLAASNMNVLLRIKWLDGAVSSALLKPSAPFHLIPEKSAGHEIAATYLQLGAKHILSGVDHLLFVFALVLIVRGPRQLLITITAFTLAHSITLGAATLGYVQVPQQPVEAVIALSILFLAVEIIHTRQGHVGAVARWPWVVAFVFGLLHGFGFAGALAEIGLPWQAIPLALVFFNLGVEFGQLLFVAMLLLLGWLLHRAKQPWLLAKGEVIATYAIGSLSAFWLFERVASF
ncbi:HupE/UreJ family protein [Thiolapillus sp.]